MVISIAVRRRALDAMVVLFADVKLTADDWLDSRGFCSVNEMHSAKNIAVVGHGHGGHAEFFYTLAELLDVTSTVEHGIVSVEMEVDELRHRLLSFYVRLGGEGKLGSQYLRRDLHKVEWKRRMFSLSFH